MYVIYKIVGGFYYYARIENRYSIIWVGITESATKYPDKQTASIKAESLNLNPEQIKKV